MQRLCSGVAPAGRRRVLALDGKTLRGSRHAGSAGVSAGIEVAGRHLFAVVDQHTRGVLGQTALDGKSSEISRFAPLLDTLTDIDLAGVVITAATLHTSANTSSICPPAAPAGGTILPVAASALSTSKDQPRSYSAEPVERERGQARDPTSWEDALACGPVPGAGRSIRGSTKWARALQGAG